MRARGQRLRYGEREAFVVQSYGRLHSTARFVREQSSKSHVPHPPHPSCSLVSSRQALPSRRQERLRVLRRRSQMRRPSFLRRASRPSQIAALPSLGSWSASLLSFLWLARCWCAGDVGTRAAPRTSQPKTAEGCLSTQHIRARSPGLSLSAEGVAWV